MKNRLLIFFYILVLGLIPLLWFKGDKIITGTDLDFPIYPDERLYERLHTWYSENQLGINRSNNIGSLPYFFITALFYKIGFNVVVTQKLTFVLLFFLTGCSIYFLTDRLLSKEKGNWVIYAKLFSVLIYMVNFYNIFVWERLQMAVTVQILVPIFLGVLITVLQENILLKKDIFLITLAFFIGGSLGIQPPIIYVLIMATIVLIAFYTVFGFLEKNLELVWPKIKKLLTLGVISTLVSGYWLLPLLNFISTAKLFDASKGRDIYNVENLLAWTSNITSFRNVFRNLGDVVWFDGWGGENYFPEFISLNQNTFFIVLSFLVFAGVISTFVFKDYRNRKALLALLFLTSVMLFFSKGNHPPFETIFEVAFKYLPGFWIHRAPWQKFTIFVLPGIAVLGGVGLARAKELFSGKKGKGNHGVPIFLFLIFFVVYFWINGLFVFGKMFQEKTIGVGYYGKNNIGFHQEFPKYIYEIREHFKFERVISNIMLLPDMHTNAYTWGYAGAADITSLVLNKGAIFNSYGEGFTIEGSVDGIYSSLVRILYNKANYDLEKMLGYFNIEYILQRNDFKYDFFGDTDSPAFIASRLGQSNITDKNTFGEWDLYQTGEDIHPAVYTSVVPVGVHNVETNILHTISSSDTSFSQVFISDKNYEGEIMGKVFISKAPKIKDTEKRAENIIYWAEGWAWPDASVVPNSISYPLARLKENAQLRQRDRESDDYIDVLIWHASKRVAEISKFRNLDENKKLSLLEDFINGQERILSLLNEDIKRDPSDRKYSKDMIRKAASYHQEALFALNEEEYISGETFEHLYEIYDKYLSLSFVTGTEVCDGFCYEFDIEDEGQYSIRFISDDYLTSKLNPDEVTVSVRKETGEILYSGYLNDLPESLLFQPGSYSLKLFLLERRNLLEDVEIDDLDLEQEDNLLLRVGALAPLLNTASIDNVKRFTIDSTLGFNKYDLTFDYNIGSGRLGVVVFEESVDGQYTVRYMTKLSDLRGPSSVESIRSKEDVCEDLGKESCYQRLSVNVSTTANSEVLYFYIFTYAPRAVETELILNNFNLKRQLKPNLMLEKVYVPINMKAPPKISFYRVNPTKYKILVENTYEPFYLVLNQTFDKGWKLYKGGDFSSRKTVFNRTYLNGLVDEYEVAEKEKFFETLGMDRISSDEHYQVNYFANSWYIDPSDFDEAYELTIEFFPQSMFYFGAIISTATLLSTGLYFATNVRRDKQ